MKKFFTLFLLSIAAAVTPQAQAALFETSFATQDDFNLWTVIDSNADSTTWKFSDGSSPSNVYYQYGAVQADDWLISPAITATDGGTYKVSYSVKGSSYYNEALEVYTGTAATVAGMTTKRATYDPVAGDVTTYFFLIKVEAGTTFHVGFHCVSPADLWRLYLCSVSVAAAEDAPDLKVTAVKSPVTGNDLAQETVTVTIANDGTLDAKDFPVAFSVDGTEAGRDTVAQTVKAGETLDYTFTAKADLSVPRHLYTFSAYTALSNDIEPSNDTLSVQIRHKAAATVPYTMGFELDEYTEDFKFYNLNNDDGDWSIYTNEWWTMLSRSGNRCLAYNYDSDNAADDWAILEPIKIEEAGTYVLRFWYSGDDNHPEKLAVYYGNGGTPDDMKNKIVEYAPYARGAYEESVSIINIDSPQTIYIGFYAFSDKDENWICVDDVQFYKASGDNVDIVVNSLTTPFEYVRTPNNSDAVFELRNVGISDAQVKVTCKVDDVVKAESTIEMKAQEYKTVSASGVLSGVAEGSHVFSVSVECSGDTNTVNNSLTRDIVVLGSPVQLYDFEDGKTPSDFTFRTEDKGTINANAGSEWNEYGWGIIPVEGAMYGKYVFAGNSWIDGVESADRWLILPKVKVGEGDSYFVWDASSGNSTLLESYQVKVSDGSMEPKDYWYTTEKEVYLEGISPTTRGISLKKYAGKEVYVGIRLISEICEFLAIDNIGFYGDVSFLETGINEIHAASAQADNTVYSIDGRVMRDTSNLEKGIYICNGRKFVVK